MVQHVIDAPAETVDQAPDVEVQTEDAPETVVAAEPVEEAAAEEPEQLEPEPEARSYTAAELQAETQRVARETAAATLEWDRRNRQSENARRESEKTRREQAQTRMAESAETVLLKHGISPDPEVVSDLINRFGNTRSDLDIQTSSSDAELAVRYLTAPLMGDNRSPEDWALTPGASAYAQAVRPHLERLIAVSQTQGQQAVLGDYIHKDELPKLVDAEIAKRSAKSREGKTNLTRVEGGAGATLDRSHEATIARIADGKHDATDSDYYQKWRASRSR